MSFLGLGNISINAKLHTSTLAAIFGCCITVVALFASDQLIVVTGTLFTLWAGVTGKRLHEAKKERGK